MDEEDLYAVLGIQAGEAKVSQLDLRKAFRTRALALHPDKQAGKKPADVAAAAVEFEKVRTAHEVLSNENARKAYDESRELRRSRVEKEKQLSSKRQKMMQDLRDREKAYELEKATKREEDVEDVVARTLQAEMDLILAQRNVAKRKVEAEIAQIRAQNKKRTTPVSSQPSGQTQSGPSDTQRTRAPTRVQATDMGSILKVTWAMDGRSVWYTHTRLKEIFEEFGAVGDVVVRVAKSRKKGSALVAMISREAAIAAANVLCGDLSSPVLAVPLLSSASIRTKFRTQAAPEKVDGITNVVGTGCRLFV